MITKKISLEERARFVKREIVKSEIDGDRLVKAGLYKTLYGIGGTIIGAGFWPSIFAFFYGVNPSEWDLSNPIIIGTAILGGIMGLTHPTKIKTKINYYDDGLYDDGGKKSKIYDAKLYTEKCKQEKEKVTEENKYSLESKKIIYDDGIRASDRGFHIDPLVYFRGEKMRKTFEDLKRIKIN